MEESSTADTPPGATKNLDEIFHDIYYSRHFEIESKFIEDIPRTIYHYTSLDAFIEIVQSRTLRASRSEFLNDLTEFRYGQKVAIDQIDKLEQSDPKYTYFAKRLKEALSGPTNSPFVACFCQDGDLLSQWRGYSSHGQGISLGLHTPQLRQIKRVILSNVIYESDRQSEFLFSEIKLLADCFLAVGYNLADRDIFRKLVGHSGTIEKYCALVKDSAFREENELRFVVPDYNVRPEFFKVEFRVRNSLIVPYILINLGANWDSVIAKVIVGPGPDREIRRRNVQHFISQMGLRIPVELSGCQFR